MRMMGFDVRPAWCAYHDDFAWLHTDGSGACVTTFVIEAGPSDCRLKALPKSVERAMEKVRAPSESEGGE